MIYRVDFVDRFSYSVLHSIALTDGLDNIRMNADKIAGSNYFAKEPRRVGFECFKDDWIETNILSGDNEFIRYISHFMVRLYENNQLIFHGIIDTSFVSYNAKTDIVSFTCYDYLRLFSKFQDDKMLYSLHSGYSADFCFRYMSQGVELALNNEITIPMNWFNYTPQSVQVTDLDILTLNWRDDVMSKFRYYGTPYCVYGFRYSNRFSEDVIPEFRVYLRAYKHSANPPLTVKCRVYGKTFRFYNNIGFVEDENAFIDEVSDEYGVSHSDEMNAWRNEIAGAYMPYYSGYSNVFAHAGNTYSFSLDDDDLEYATASAHKSVTFSGNAIPANIYPKGLYEGGNEPIEKLKVLKAALLLHNLTIVSIASGQLRLVNKNDSSNTLISIDNADIIEFKRKRLNRSKPDVSSLGCLIGNST
ncbi:MAG: hypothetical protein K8S56_02575 [Candidatus Cloacimonetes bacterium]|nr:hypothetical protein [Candidatus Cloacimonadota bacterium]